MPQIKISKAIGKNCYPEEQDVKLIQTCLANIKMKTKFGMKAIWQGKIDGRNSKDLICAIENFQVSEGLPATGKIQAFSDRTFQKIKTKAPQSVLKSFDDEYHKPTMGSYDTLMQDKDRATMLLKDFIKDLKKVDQYNKILKSAGKLDQVQKKMYDRVRNWFGQANSKHIEKLLKKADHMIEIASGSTGWKFIPYYNLGKYGVPNAWTIFMYREEKIGYKILKSKRHTIEFFESYSKYSDLKRAAIFIHELVHASNGRNGGYKSQNGHFIKCSDPKALQFTDSSEPDPSVMTSDQAILNADSWEGYILNDGTC